MSPAQASRWPFLKAAPCVIWCLALSAFVAVVWYGASPSFSYSYNSPHGVYRLEFHKASILARLIHHLKCLMSCACIACPLKKLLRERVVDLQSGGQFDWLLDAPVAINKVMIGSVVLSKAFLPNAETRRWARGARQDREAR
ncbi:hypothetical protein [Acidovorax sp. PRC11]|uniref:hypothetical protein n=1 Tax=Acidovorax sp. PRC11 TaxID=2962592 RepID=UPI0028834CC3|nr:hypothetical protein [Acidovorax sp. PRC11]